MKKPALLKKIKDLLEDKKGTDILILDVGELVSYTDFLVLCTGTSSAHIHALVSHLRESLKKDASPTYINPSRDDSWWIVDFVDVVVHIFKEDARLHYDLENLWSDAKRVKRV